MQAREGRFQKAWAVRQSAGLGRKILRVGRAGLTVRDRQTGAQRELTGRSRPAECVTLGVTLGAKLGVPWRPKKLSSSPFALTFRCTWSLPCFCVLKESLCGLNAVCWRGHIAPWAEYAGPFCNESKRRAQMSWIEKELKRRAARPAAALKARAVSGTDSQMPGESEAMQLLWHKIEALNRALPEELRLQDEPHRQDGLLFDTPPFRMWLMAPNGAGLGFTGEGVRYCWPVLSRRRSHNFWIRWHEKPGYRVTQRLVWSWTGASAVEAAFDEASLEHVIQCLVQGRRVRLRALRVRRKWWPF